TSWAFFFVRLNRLWIAYDRCRTMPPSHRWLRLLRRLTVPLSRLPVLHRISIAVRAHYSGLSEELKLDDFDGDLVFYCRLDSAITSRIFWNGLYSRSSLVAISKLLDRQSVVFDIGANEGEHTVFCAKRVPDGKVYAFEPNPAVRAHLVRNVSANDFANVVVVPIAL